MALLAITLAFALDFMLLLLLLLGGGGVTLGAPSAAPSAAFLLLLLLLVPGDATLVGDRCRGCCPVDIQALDLDDIMVSWISSASHHVS